jgi:hypothetical protein
MAISKAIKQVAAAAVPEQALKGKKPVPFQDALSKGKPSETDSEVVALALRLLGTARGIESKLAYPSFGYDFSTAEGERCSFNLGVFNQHNLFDGHAPPPRSTKEWVRFGGTFEVHCDLPDISKLRRALTFLVRRAFPLFKVD